MIERIYADSIEKSIQRDLANPAPPPEQSSFNAWSFTQAGFAGIPRGGFEYAGDIADLSTMLAGEEYWLTQRYDLPGGSRVPGDEFRRKAQEYAPDPQTAHKADQVINGLTRGVGKAVGAIATTGPLAGSAIFGASEANNEYRRLVQEGVDEATAAKVAGVTGITSALGAGLPAGGSTALRTMLIAGAAGPGTFVAQQKLSKDILQEAGYQNQADKFDPTDPLGLILSVGIPGAVGVLHMRSLGKQKLAETVKQIESGGRRYGADGELLTSPKGAQGEMQVMPGTATDPGFGVTPARDNSPDELARVGRDYLDAMTNRYDDPDKALAAYNAGPGAVDNAVKKYGDDWLAHMPEETRAYVAKANKILSRDTVANVAADEAVVDAARVRTLDDVVASRIPEGRSDGYGEVMRASDEVAAGRIHEDLPDTDVPQFRDPETVLPEPRTIEVEQAVPQAKTAPFEGMQETQGLERLAAEYPELEIRLPGSDETVGLKSAMDRIEAARADETQEAEWVRVAMECALSGGAKAPDPEVP